MNFSELGLNPAILSAVEATGYTTPTDVQQRAIPAALQGGDLLVSSSTGSGKTAAFVLPALEKILQIRIAQGFDAANPPGGLEEQRPQRGGRGRPQQRFGGRNERFGDRRPPRGSEGAEGTAPRAPQTGARVLVLAPTRELALQVSKAAMTYGRGIRGLRVASVVGGVPYGAQIAALRGSPDILIATPGRLIDLLQSGSASLKDVQMLVLDEADRMLDMGFIEDITHIAEQIPEARQTLMFSATFGGQVGGLAMQLTRDAKRIEVAHHTERHANIEQRLHWADSLGHKNALLEQLLAEREMDQAVVFTSTQRDADELADRLADMGHAVASLHGGLPQGRRNRVLMALRQRQLRVLVATDVAARGIDVPTISHVINYGLPLKAEDYVHRIGRTGRAGRSGLAITLAERRDVGMIRRIERFTTQLIPTAVVAGLEPKMPEPSRRPAGAPRPEGGFPPRRGGRFEGRPEGRFEGRPEGRFDGRNDAPRPEGRFENRFDGDRRRPGPDHHRPQRHGAGAGRPGGYQGGARRSGGGDRG